MAIHRVRLHRQAHLELGQTGVNDLCRNLYRGDCQTCGRPLGEQPPAVVIEQVGSTPQAHLHHETCRRPAWTSHHAPVAGDTPPAALSYTTHHMLPQFTVFPGSPAGLPITVINPGLEGITLGRADDGTWKVNTVERYIGYGMQRASVAQPLRPVAGSAIHADVRPDGSNPTCVVKLDADRTWITNPPHFILTAIERLRGAALLVTTAINPLDIDNNFDRADLLDLIGSGKCAGAWIPLAGIHRPS